MYSTYTAENDDGKHRGNFGVSEAASEKTRKSRSSIERNRTMYGMIMYCVAVVSNLEGYKSNLRHCFSNLLHCTTSEIIRLSKYHHYD